MIKEDDYIGLYTETLKPRNPLDLYKTLSLQLLKHKAVNHLKIRTAQICFGEASCAPLYPWAFVSYVQNITV